MASNKPLHVDMPTARWIHQRAVVALRAEMASIGYARPDIDREVAWQELLHGARFLIGQELGGAMPDNRPACAPECAGSLEGAFHASGHAEPPPFVPMPENEAGELEEPTAWPAGTGVTEVVKP